MRRIVLASAVVAVVLGAVLVQGCTDKSAESSTGPAAGKTLVMFKQIANDWGDSASSTKVGDVTQNRNQLITFTQVASDARLNGAGEMTVNDDSRDDGSSTGWGTYKITNDGGAWEGDWASASPAKLDSAKYFSTTLTGTGDYKGLVGHFLGSWGGEEEGGKPVSTFTGWIEPAK